VKVTLDRESVARLMHEKAIRLGRICARSYTINREHHFTERQENLILLVIDSGAHSTCLVPAI
jgi:hypothetical protein